MQLRSRLVARALASKGFKESQGKHRFFIFYTSDNKKSQIQTMISQGSDHDLDAVLIGEMARQCKLKKKEFLQLVNCTLNRAAYETKLVSAGEL